MSNAVVEEVAASSAQPKCAAIAEAGIGNSQQTIAYLSALIADASAGRVTTGLVHGTCNAIGKMLRVVEMEARYGTTSGGDQQKCLQFVQGREAPQQDQHLIASSDRARALAKLSAEDRIALGIAG